MVVRKLLFLACATLMSCDKVTKSVHGTSWVAAPRIVRSTSLDSTEFSLADSVFAKATQSGLVVDSQIVQFSKHSISLVIPNEDICHFTLIGYRAGRLDTVWYGSGILSPSIDSASAQSIAVSSGSWLEVPVFSLVSGAYNGTQMLIVKAPNGKYLVDSVNGEQRKIRVQVDSILLDTSSLVVARLLSGDDGFRGRAAVETLSIHLVKPMISSAQAEFNSGSMLSARSPSGDSLEYSLDSARMVWNFYTSSVSVGSKGYFWVRSKYKGAFSDCVGGHFQPMNDDSLPHFSIPGGNYRNETSLAIKAPDGRKVYWSINGGLWSGGVNSTTLKFDTFSIIRAHLDTLAVTPPSEIAETLSVHLVAPTLSLLPGTLRTAKIVTATSPSGDSLEYSTSSTKTNWKAYVSAVGIDSSTYFWVRATYKGVKSDTVGGAYVLKSDSTDQGMKLIPSGSFKVQDENGNGVTTTITGFLMDSTEVTQAKFASTMNFNPSAFLQVNADSLAVYPVEKVSWFDAVAYCNTRSKNEGYDTVYNYSSVTKSGNSITDMGGFSYNLSKNGYRLPTDAEWEYAYRAGTTADYYWGSVTDNTTTLRYGWFDPTSALSLMTTHSVARLIKNAWGLYDMAGNVAEFTQDWYSDSFPTPRSGNKAADPTGPTSEASDYEGMRVVRGGSWGSAAYVYLSASGSRSQADQASKSQNIGFRCVRRLSN